MYFFVCGGCHKYFDVQQTWRYYNNGENNLCLQCGDLEATSDYKIITKPEYNGETKEEFEKRTEDRIEKLIYVLVTCLDKKYFVPKVNMYIHKLSDEMYKDKNFLYKIINE